MMAEFDIGPTDRLLHKSTLAFDPHLREIALPLIAGAVMIILPQSEWADLLEEFEIVSRERITIYGGVPSVLNCMLEWDGVADLKSLRVYFCGGEAWSAELAKKFYSCLPACELRNSYGPAETTVCVSNWKVPASAELSRIELGPPCANVIFFVEQGPAESDGNRSIGRLHIGGVQVADGYVDSSADGVFHSSLLDGELVRFYRTGDLVAVQGDALVFIGREDFQLKVNGVRIEPQEIEAVIGGLENVERCVVVPDSAAASERLCAIVKGKPERSVRAERIRQECTQRLPPAFVPARIVVVDNLPELPSGKADRVAIRAMLHSGAV